MRVEEKKGYSDSEAALKLQVSVRTLQEWKQGRARLHDLPLRTLHQMTRA